jgi:hypothetical protein
MFIKPTSPEASPACMDKGKEVIGGDVPALTSLLRSLLPLEGLLDATTVA